MWSRPNLRNFSGIYLEGLRNATKNVRLGSPVRDSNRELPGMLVLEPTGPPRFCCRDDNIEAETQAVLLYVMSQNIVLSVSVQTLFTHLPGGKGRLADA
jgi:hypothetical protein